MSHLKQSKTFRSPGLEGKQGIPPGVGEGSLPKKGELRSPSQIGKKGQPGKAGFPGYPAARD